jgi:hypothetical protein
VTVTVAPTRLEEAQSLSRMLQGVLDQVVASYAAVPLSLPSRQYWTLQQPAADCEQLVVSFMQAYMGPPGDEASTPQRCNSPRTAVLQVQVIRCIPTAGPKGKAPTAQQIQDGSEQLAMDVWLLLDIAADLEQWDAPLGGFGLGVIATVAAEEPLGGFQAVTLSISMAIP